MGLFEKLKSLLGLEESAEESSDERRDVGITVEREGEDRSAGGTGGGASGATADAGDGAGPGGSGSTSTASGGVSASDAAATTGSESDTATAAGGGAAPTPDAESEDAEPRVPSEAVDVIKGIGPTYAGRLSDAGIETVDDLAAAEAGEVADRADVPEGRLDDWIERARNRSR